MSLPDDVLTVAGGHGAAPFHAYPDDEVFTTATATLGLAAGAQVRLFIAVQGANDPTSYLTCPWVPPGRSHAVERGSLSGRHLCT